MIPTYNQEAYLAQAIESCLMQDYEHLNVVVADDCSTDGTGSVASRYSGKSGISCHRNTTNIGRVANYANTLSKLVTTEWVVNLDGDDYYTDNTFISKAMSDIREAGRRGFSVVAHLGNHNLDVAGRHLPGAVVLESGSLCVSGKTYFREYPRAGQFAHMSCIYRADTARQSGGYDLDSVASDFHALMKVFLHGDVILGENQPGVWRIHGGNASQSNLRQKYLSAFSMYEDLARHAGTFFSTGELTRWKAEMRDGAYDDYILTACSAATGIGSVISLLKDFRFRRVFLDAIRLLAKRAFRTTATNSEQA
jgi:glycosyltransferase involved in cell wall biosynthesis